MSNNFRVGQKVVCVDDAFAPCSYQINWPKRGRVYTVAEICHVKSEASLRLAELPHHEPVIWTCGVEAIPAFRASRFRPAVDRKEDLSIFYKMLEPGRVDA